MGAMSEARSQESEQRQTGSRRVSAGAAWPEDLRLAALQSLNILDTPPEPAFERIVELARRLFGAPMVAVSLIDRDRQWFKARCGLDATETSRSVSFCTHAIREPERVFVVPDATKDALFAQNPLVTGGPKIRFYAGAVVFSPDGAPIGTLCIIDGTPRLDFGADDRRALSDLAGLASDELALRATARSLERQLSELESTRRRLEGANRTLNRLNRRMEEDLERASAAQKGHLPRAIMRLSTLSIASLHLPSEAMAGDMLGYEQLNADHACVWIADVVGHGLRAALQSVTLSSLMVPELLTQVSDGRALSPERALRRINRLMLRPGEEESHYLCLSYLLVPERGTRLSLIPAGMPWPLLQLPGERPRFLETGGLPLGLFDDVPQRRLELDLPVGARLLLYSDGLTDCSNSDGAQFGAERLQRWMEEAASLSVPRAVVDLRQEVYAWTGRRAPDDDVAAVLLERLPPEA